MENSRTPNLPVAIFIVFQAIIIILLIISLFQLFNSGGYTNDTEYNQQQPKAQIKDIDKTITDASAVDLDYIRQNLFQAISINTPNIDTKDLQATIRQDSTKTLQFDHPEFTFYSFTVDIPSLQQSYQIFYTYPDAGEIYYIDPDNPVTILCLDNSDDIIYPDFDCKNYSKFTTRNTIAAEYLRYFDFADFDIAFSKDFKELTIGLKTSQTDDSKLGAYLQTVKDTIKSLGISPDIFTYLIKQPSEETYTQY